MRNIRRVPLLPRVLAVALLPLAGPTLVADGLPVTLKAVYDAAGPGGAYDKHIVLETGAIYTGGLWIGGTFNRITAEFEAGGADVRIVGNGAVLDLQGGEICLAYCNNRLEIEDCVIINGNVRFRGYEDDVHSFMPVGSIRYVTFFRPHDYAIRLNRCGAGILVERCLAVDALDTGPDFQYLTGMPMEWLATGVNFAISLVGGQVVRHNWSFHTDPEVNADLRHHFCFL